MPTQVTDLWDPPESRPVPCPPSPTLPLALGVGGHGGCPSPGSPGSAGRTTAGVSTRAVALPCAAASRAFLRTGSRSWSQRLCRSLLSEVRSCRARQPRSRSPGVSDSRQKVRPDPRGKASIRAINRIIHLPSSVTEPWLPVLVLSSWI